MSQPDVNCHKMGLWCSVNRNDGKGSKEHAMSTNLYVGNLSFQTSTSQLESLFADFGEVTSAQVITDRDTGQSRGFGFVEMKTSDQANSAISGLNGREIDGRQLKVNVAKPRSR
jgi:RNA recognition motif-containing protein